MQSVYFAAPADRDKGHSLKESYPSAEMQSVYFAAPADSARLFKVNFEYIKWENDRLSELERGVEEFTAVHFIQTKFERR